MSKKPFDPEETQWETRLPSVTPKDTDETLWEGNQPLEGAQPMTEAERATASAQFKLGNL